MRSACWQSVPFSDSLLTGAPPPQSGEVSALFPAGFNTGADVGDHASIAGLVEHLLNVCSCTLPTMKLL